MYVYIYMFIYSRCNGQKTSMFYVIILDFNEYEYGFIYKKEHSQTLFIHNIFGTISTKFSNKT